mgnify:CR=1 FL=1
MKKYLARRDFIKLIGFGTAGFYSGLSNADILFASKSNSVSVEKNSNRKTNIILCMTDDQGWGDTVDTPYN